MDNSLIIEAEKISNRTKTCLDLFFHLCRFLDVLNKIPKKNNSIWGLFTKEIKSIIYANTFERNYWIHYVFISRLKFIWIYKKWSPNRPVIIIINYLPQIIIMIKFVIFLFYLFKQVWICGISRYTEHYFFTHSHVDLFDIEQLIFHMNIEHFLYP